MKILGRVKETWSEQDSATTVPLPIFVTNLPTSIVQFTITRRFVIAPDQFLQNDHSIPINTLSHCDMPLVPAVLTDKGSKDENKYIDHSNYNRFPLSKPIKGLRQGIRTSFVPPQELIRQSFQLPIYPHTFGCFCNFSSDWLGRRR